MLSQPPKHVMAELGHPGNIIQADAAFVTVTYGGTPYVKAPMEPAFSVQNLLHRLRVCERAVTTVI